MGSASAATNIVSDVSADSEPLDQRVVNKTPPYRATTDVPEERSLASRPSFRKRLSHKASDLFLGRRQSSSNFRASETPVKPARCLRRRMTLSCVAESPASKPVKEDETSPNPKAQRLLRSNFPFIAPLNLEDGSSIADFESMASSNATVVRRATPGNMANESIRSEVSETSPAPSSDSFKALDIKPFYDANPGVVDDLRRRFREGDWYPGVDLNLRYSERLFGRRDSRFFNHCTGSDRQYATQVPMLSSPMYEPLFTKDPARVISVNKNPLGYSLSAFDNSSSPCAPSAQDAVQTAKPNPFAYDPTAFEDSFTASTASSKTHAQVTPFTPGSSGCIDSSSESRAANEAFFTETAMEGGGNIALMLAEERIVELHGQNQVLRSRNTALKASQVQSLENLEAFQERLRDLVGRIQELDSELGSLRGQVAEEK